MKYYQTYKSKEIKPFEEYFENGFLNRILFKARLFNGDSDIDVNLN